MVGSRREQILALLTAGDPDTPLVQRVCEVSAELLGVSGAGMCLVGGRSHQIVVHGTTRRAEQLEDLQLELGQGPCMQAVRTGSPILVPDLDTHLTVSWPVFADHALGLGVRALFSFPLETGITTLGALDLYRDTPGALTGPELMDALTLTEIAAQAMAAQRDRVYLDGSVSALHWVATGHPFPADPAGTAGPGAAGGEPVTRGQAVDLGITVAQALASPRLDEATDPLGDRPGTDRLTGRTLDRAATLTGPVATAGSGLRPAGERVVGDTAEDRARRLVLVVADEAGLRLVLGRALARAGYQVLLADTVDAGIAQLAARPELAAVIADITLPTRTGLDFTAAVIAHHPAVPLLVLTGGPGATGALDDPLIRLLAKPVRTGDLRVQLADLIDRAARPAAPQFSAEIPTEPEPGSPGPVAPEPDLLRRGPLIGVPGRRVEPGGRLGVLPELDAETTTWAAVAGLTGLTGHPVMGGPAGVSAVPGAVESTRLASLGLFAAGVANSVNNMLAVISMRAELLADGEDGHPPTPAAAEDVAAITAATTRASGLVQQLMLFAGQRTLDRGPVDVAALITDLQPRFDALAGGPGIITCTSEPVPHVIGDHEHLERVLLNLVHNALSATPPPQADPAVPLGPGGTAAPPRVRVRVTPTSVGDITGWAVGHPAPGVVLEVTDTGGGMPPEVRDRAVEPFFRAATSSGGSGLGLTIVDGIITQHGGRLAIDSTPGRGTTVRVTLPADPAPDPGDQLTARVR